MVSKYTFWTLGSYVFDRLIAWAKAEHPDKKINWILKRHFSIGKRKWDFSGIETGKGGKKRVIQLFSIGMIHIRRHVKVRADANPFDKEYEQYFAVRRDKKVKAKKTC